MKLGLLEEKEMSWATLLVCVDKVEIQNYKWAFNAT
jgi:hypothetical protein